MNKLDIKKYIDGLSGQTIKGWAKECETVAVSLNGEFFKEVPCNEYREDLVEYLENPRAGFSCELASHDVIRAMHNVDGILVRADFKIDGHVIDFAELLLKNEDVFNAFDIDNIRNITSYFDGLQGDFLTGWSIDASIVKLYIENTFIGTSEITEYREDIDLLHGHSNSGFYYNMDGRHFANEWRNKDSLFLKAEFLDDGGNIVNIGHNIVDTKALFLSIYVVAGTAIGTLKETIESSLLWDAEFYLKQLGDCKPLNSDLLIDFLIAGVSGGLNPCESFNTFYYLAHNPDVTKNGVNPFYHYLTIGESEGRRPSIEFNSHFYGEIHPDLSNWDFSLLAHYVIAGKKEGRICNEYIKNTNSVRSIDPYSYWQLENETIKYNDVRVLLESFDYNPLISILVPVYNPQKALLIECIESVLSQSYSKWQLCLADDNSSEEYVKEVLKHYQELDSRINVVFRDENGHISAATNSALAIAEGEWTALLDHDDLLHEHALFNVIKVINKNSCVEFIYSDEDKLDVNGKRVDPHFKSRWNLDLLYSQNYVSHLGVYKTNIINDIGGFRKGYEGSQDYDLLLRYSREIDHANIIHIPMVLYHWRMVEGSTALASDEKSYTTNAGIKALKDHLESLGEDATVEAGSAANMYKVNWPSVNADKREPLVSLIIPTYNGYEITKQAIESIFNKTNYQNYEILLVDNNSSDSAALEYFEQLDKNQKVTVLRYPHPFNYSAINNFAAEQANGEIIGLINNDVEVINPEWLTEMVSHAQRNDIGCVGAMLYFDNDTIQHAGVICGLGGVAGHSHKHFPKDHPGYFFRLKLVQNLSAVTAACLLVRKSVFEEVQGLNEQDLTIAFNDVDFCLKVQAAGYRNLWTPYAELYHYESITRGAEDNPEKIARFNKEVDYMKDTWGTDKKTDPCYSPNLTTAREDFSYSD